MHLQWKSKGKIFYMQEFAACILFYIKFDIVLDWSDQ